MLRKDCTTVKDRRANEIFALQFDHRKGARLASFCKQDRNGFQLDFHRLFTGQNLDLTAKNASKITLLQRQKSIFRIALASDNVNNLSKSHTLKPLLNLSRIKDFPSTAVPLTSTSRTSILPAIAASSLARKANTWRNVG